MAEAQEGRVKIDEGVVFGQGGGRELRCDIFRPPEPLPDRKAVLLIHGGGWAGGDRQQLRGYGIQLGRLGYLCVATEYRLSGESKWPAQIHDVKACLRFMRAESRGLGIDPQKITVSGNSAGGHLALIAAATPDLREFEGDGGNPGAGTAVEACVAFYAPSLLVPTHHGTDGMVPALFGRGASEATMLAASPLHYAKREFPPTLLLHGTADEVVPEVSTMEMYRALREAGAAAELHIFAGAPHGFDAVRPTFRQCVGLIHLFLERHT